MTRLLAIGGLCVICSTGRLSADEPRVINFTVTIASAASDKLRPEMDVKELAKAVGELEKGTELASLTRLRFTVVEDQSAKFQFGETIPFVSSRASGGRGAPAGFPGGVQGFGGQAVSVSRGQVGTLIGAVARVEDGGSVIAQLEIEQTKSDARPSDEEAALGPKTSTLSFKSAVRIPAGETVVLAGLDERAAAEVKRTVVLVSAALPQGAAKAARLENELKIFKLQHANADGLHNVLSRLFPDAPLTLAIDERTNVLIARGKAEQLEVVEALARQLDQVAKP